MSRRYGNKQPAGQDPVQWTTGGYLRLSKEDGNDESYSIDNQRTWLLDYIAKHDDLTLVKFYIDDGISGTSEEERPAYQELLQDIKDGRIKCMLVKDLSRPFRNSADQTRFLEETRVRYDVRFISTRLPFVDSLKHPDTLNMLSIGFQGMMNENHCRETSLKVRDVFEIKRKKGQFIGAFAPYGYAKDPNDKNRLILDEEAAEVVRDIFTWFCSGMSKRGITGKLNELGIPNPTQYKRKKGLHYKNPHDRFSSSLWQERTVYQILGNQIYIGHMVQGKQMVKSYKVHERVSVPEEKWFIVENTHDPIVDKDAFATAQSLMKRNTRTAPSKGELSLFAGFIRCADCEKAMTRKTSKSLCYYVCRTYARQSKSKCTKHSIREDVLYQAVLAAIQIQVHLLDDPAELIDEIHSALKINPPWNRLDAMLEQQREALKNKKNHAKTLYTDLLDGLLTRAEYIEFKKVFRDEAASIEGKIAKLEHECGVVRAGEHADHPSFAYFKKHKQINALDRKILAELIDHVLVHEGGQVEIIFNLDDPYQRILGS